MGAYEGGWTAEIMTLSIETVPPEGGQTAPPAGTHHYVRGESATIKVCPTGMRFTGWSGQVSGPEKQISVAMDGDKTVTANFSPNIARVDGGNVAGPWDGSSWATAFRDIQSAVAAVSAESGEVWVVGGIYTAAATPVLTMEPQVAVYGGFAGGEDARDQRNWAVHTTIIDGEGARQCVVGADDATLDGCTVMSGAGNNGGGVYNYSASPVFRNCIFTANNASAFGGAVYDNYASPVFMNCVFAGNEANTSGGALYNTNASPVLMNCTFAGNTAQYGGAVYSIYNSNCTLTNCILWGDTAASEPEIYGSPSKYTTTYCCVKGGATGPGNISADPLFLGADSGGSVQLREGSPCIDSGTLTGAPATDLPGRARPQGAGIDMGAYEGGRAAADIVSLTVQVSPSDGGETTPQAGTYYYGQGETAVLEVRPTRMRFVGWSGAVTGMMQRICVSMDTDKTVTANFLPAIFYVNLANTGGPWDGRSWATAFRDVQSGVDAAYVVAGEVWVAGGTYTAAIYPVLEMRPGIPVYGGFAGTETEREQRDWTSHVTTLDGQNAGRCIVGGDGSTLDGLIVTRGLGNPHGGGIYNSGGSANFVNCSFVGNRAPWGGNGGGMYNDDAATVLMNCTFSGNSTNGGGYGGGMYNRKGTTVLMNCTFSGNSTNDGGGGGGISNYYTKPTLTNCIFSRNKSSFGGGVSNEYSTLAELTNCTFYGNTAYDGGGMNIHDDWAGLTNCTFTGNSAILRGGAIDCFADTAILSNCVFIGNTVKAGYESAGGGIHIWHCSPQLMNCTFSGNSSDFEGGAVYGHYYSAPQLTNCILWGDAAPSNPEIGVDSSSTMAVTYSCVEGGLAGLGNFYADPEFVQDSTGNVQLKADSPCIDSGTAVGAPSGDMLGIARPQGNGVDVGAYETPYLGALAVPDVVGQTQQQAVASLAGWTFSVGTVSQEYSRSIPSGCVIQQAPVVGTMVAPRSKVNLTVSQGPRPFAVSYVASPPGSGAVNGPATILDTVGTAFLTVTPAQGYMFASLSVSNGNIGNAPYCLSNVTGDTVVTATFQPLANSVAYIASPATGGVVSGPASILTGQTATVVATANPGYTLAAFHSDSGAVSQTSPYILSNVTADTSVTAVFTANDNRVTCVAAPSGWGSLTAPVTIRTGDSAPITVTPGPGYHVVSVTVSNGVVTGTAPYILSNVTDKTTVTAVFAANENGLTYLAEPVEGGAVTGPPTIWSGDTATLTATPNKGYHVAGVTASNGSVTATAPYALSNVTGDAAITARFAANSNPVAYLASPVEGGSISGPGTVLTGGTATIAATPNPGYTLSSVTASNGSITASAPHVLSGVTENVTVTATFTADSHAVAYAASPAAGGAVSGPAALATGASTTLAVTPKPGYHVETVAVINGSVTPVAPYMLSGVTADTTVTATFAANINRVTYAANPSGGGTVAGPETLPTDDTAVVTVTPSPQYVLLSLTASTGLITPTAPHVLSGVTEDTTVTATFARQRVTVPDVTGQTQTAATAAFTDAGLVLGAVTQVCSATVPAGSVVTQDPAAGTEVAPGSQINLAVSQGPEPAEGEGEGEVEGETPQQVAVPDVSGISSDQAQTALIAAGLVVSITEENNDDIPAGQVVRQEPAAGTQVTAGTRINLIVSSGPEDTGCGCAGCGGKSAITVDKMKRTFGGLFLSAMTGRKI